MNYKYIKKDILWALAISIALMLTGSAIATGFIWPIGLFILTLILSRTSIKKSNLCKIVSIGRILALQNSLIFLWSMYYLIQNLFSALPNSLYLIFSTAPLGLATMVTLYLIFSSWSTELSKDKIIELKTYKKQMIIIGVLLLLLAFNLIEVFS